MREVKFRQKLKDSLVHNGEKFHYWGYLDGGFTSPVGKTQSNGSDEQFTGLKDKSGVDIYEGDIVREGDCIGAVVFDEPRAYFCYESLTGRAGLYAFYGEVIGNIHQTPELLTNG